MKKALSVICIFLIIIICGVFLAGPLNNVINNTGTVKNMLKLQSDDVQKITVRSGNNGKLYVLDNPEDINKFISLLNINVYKDPSQQSTTGFSYSVSFINDTDEQAPSICMQGKRLNINNQFYLLHDSDYSVINSFLKNQTI